DSLDCVQTLRKRCLSSITHALQSATSASTVRIRSGKLSVTDGPFAESKEQLGGFFLIEASDFNEAIEVAAKWPSARIGSIEVRPIEEELMMDRRYGESTLGTYRQRTDAMAERIRLMNGLRRIFDLLASLAVSSSQPDSLN